MTLFMDLDADIDEVDDCCELCGLRIAPEDWDDRHDIGNAVAHAACCVAQGCEP